jgi:hypothetical protein
MIKITHHPHLTTLVLPAEILYAGENYTEEEVLQRNFTGFIGAIISGK